MTYLYGLSATITGLKACVYKSLGVETVIGQHSISKVDEKALLGLANTLAKTVPEQGMVLYLEGDLGAGKTTFSRGLIQALGHQGAVKSPTYTLLEPYLDLQPPVLHFDLYRLSDPEELEYIGMRDYLDHAALFIFEWPSCGRNFIPAADVKIRIELESAQSRKIILQSFTAKGEALRKSLLDIP